MKILFAVSNEKVSESIIKKYESIYKEVIVGKNVYYFNAIIKELQKDKSYDRIIISEDLEPFSNKNQEAIDNFIFDKLDKISDEAVTHSGDDIPIILLCSDRRVKGEGILTKLFGIGVYSALIGQDRSAPNLCELIKKPRTKKEAKDYYKIDTSEIDYKSENENNVSEVEIQNILTHYKRLGKNEDKYIESFNSIASQYTDEQLKVIIKFLPIGVKAVLEAGSPKYQQITTFSGETSQLKNQEPYQSSQINPKTKKPRSTERAIFDNGLKIESIVGDELKRPTKPVIIPNTVSTQNVKKIQNPTYNTNNSQQQEINRTIIEDDIINENYEEPIMNFIEPEIEEPIIEEPLMEELIIEKPIIKEDTLQLEEQGQPIKRGRGRPRKVKPIPIEPISNEPKRGRGRPRKVQVQEIVEDIQKENDNFENAINIDDTFEDDIMLPSFEQNEEIKEINNNYEQDEEEIIPLGFDDDTLLPGLDSELSYIQNEDEFEIPEENKEDNILPGFDFEQNDIQDENLFETKEDENNEDMLPGFDDFLIDDEETFNQEPVQTNNYIDDFEKDNDNIIESEIDDMYSNRYQVEENNENTNIASYDKKDVNISNLLTADKKIVAFVGTAKNGTSFLVNNLAEILSKQGIKTAILDLTKNKNSYYIYTKNDEELRKKAIDSISNLENGTTLGIPVNANLDVYTALPGENRQIENYNTILETLLQNYKLILLDCDFQTDYIFIREASEIYLVQTMDVLTIQPLTAYLRDLKAKNILDQNKLRIVINKYTRVKSVSEKTIIAGMAFYNDPSMSYMTELFNRETIRYAIVPFDMQTYSKYLEGLINCNINTNGYSKDINGSLKKLANTVYPLIAGTKSGYNPPKFNKYEESNTFSNNTNDILNKMKQNY